MTPKSRSTICVRAAAPGDADVIARLHATLFDDAWTKESVAALMDRPGAHPVLAIERATSRACGFGLAQMAADEAEILSIGVATASQQNGVGGILLLSLHRAVAAAGGTKLFLDVAEDNAAARALYRRCGYVEVGRRRGYYARPAARIDAILMRAELAVTVRD